MKPDPVNTTKGGTSGRKLWIATFCGGAVTLICCLVAILIHPFAASSAKWIYWLALGSAVLCTVAAVQLRSPGKLDAADEGAWLARVGTRGSKDAWNDLDGIDD